MPVYSLHFILPSVLPVLSIGSVMRELYILDEIDLLSPASQSKTGEEAGGGRLAAFSLLCFCLPSQSLLSLCDFMLVVYMRVIAVK